MNKQIKKFLLTVGICVALVVLFLAARLVWNTVLHSAAPKGSDLNVQIPATATSTATPLQVPSSGGKG